MARYLKTVLLLVLTVSFLFADGSFRRINAQFEPITLYAPGGPIYTLDPQLVADGASLEVIENLFLGLTDVDPKTSQIRPEVATRWQMNAAGDVWTFELRTDIPWVQWNPITKQAMRVRNVVAGDFEYGIKRACDPRLQAAYTQVAAKLIKGCDLLARRSPTQVQDKDLEKLEVRALSDSQLEIHTQGVIPYFLSTSAMGMFRAVPKEFVAQFGEAWTNLGTIVTNGPYVLDENVPAARRVALKNPLYPGNVNDNYNGNIERLIFLLGCNDCVGFDQYLLNQIDTTYVGGDLVDRVRADAQLSKQYIQRSKPSIEYFVFNYDKPPFSNVHARRAFSTVIDRAYFTGVFLKGTSLPIDHFVPPGMFGAVPPSSVFVGSATNPGFDPEFAKKELAAAGYPNCKGFPTINVAVVETYQAEHIKASVVGHLGCSANTINILKVDYGTLVQMTGPRAPKEQRPNMFSAIWGADYPDAQNFIGDVLACTGANDAHRSCGQLDKAIEAARTERQPEKRVKRYAELEEALFGKKGEFPIAPVRIPSELFLVKPWYTGFFQTDGQFAGKHWNTYHIDQRMQLAARTVKP
jgi:oligopeptide transport system substrate-binding protein